MMPGRSDAASLDEVGIARDERLRSDGDGLQQPMRAWAATAIWAALLLSVLDATIVNVALPRMAQDLVATPARSIWIVNAYQIAITMLLLPVAALGEAIGFRRVYLVGIAIFVFASLGCTIAPDLAWLATFRFVQGIGAASIMGVSGALVRRVYPRALLGRGIGYNALVIAVGSAAGPTIAAAVLAVASWRWLFAINLPVGLLGLLIGIRFLPGGTPASTRFDWPRAALLAMSFGAFFLSAAGFAQGGAWPIATAEFVVAAAGFALSWRLSKGDAAPLLPIDLLADRQLRLSYMTSACSFAAQMIAYVTLPFLFHERLGLSHVAIGLLLTPWPLATAISAPIAGRLVERFPASILSGAGLGMTTSGLVLLAAIPAHSGALVFIAPMALAGAGFGLFQTPNNRVMLGQAPERRSGAAAGMLATARLTGQTGGALGVALMFRVFRVGSPIPLFVAAALACMAAVISMQRTRTSPAQADEAAAAL